MPINKSYSVLFDMDGVLVDSEPVIEAAAIAGLKEYGVQAVPEDFKPFVGAGEDKYIGGVAEKHGARYKLEMKSRVYQIYLEMVPSRLVVYEGVLELLNKLKDDGIKFALASSADRIKVDANLKAAGISPSFFSTIISGEDAERKKPYPDIYLTAAKRIGQAPSQCIVIEDALNGIQAAKAANMKCLAVATSFTRERLQQEGPDFICERIDRAYGILASIK